MVKTLRIICLIGLMSFNVFADATIPEADIEGAQDHSAVGRFEGSFIISYIQKSFDEVTFPLSTLEEVEDARDTHNNRKFEPREKKPLEGRRTRLVYLTPAGASPLEVLRNYQQELAGQGGQTLFECKGADCGGSHTRSSSGGGGKMSLSMYLWPQENIRDKNFSNGYCAQNERITDQRYTVMELPESGVYVSILTYLLESDNYCKAINDRTIAVVDIMEVKDMEAKMVTVNAEEMAQAIAKDGSVALYGIYFDSGKADIKPESEETLEQIARLLSGTPDLHLLVVGHTDSVGSFESNMDLSKRRAAAVVHALTVTYQIDKSRLMPVGVSFACPVAANATDEGRAKNRRVELVGN